MIFSCTRHAFQQCTRNPRRSHGAVPTMLAKETCITFASCNTLSHVVASAVRAAAYTVAWIGDLGAVVSGPARVALTRPLAAPSVAAATDSVARVVHLTVSARVPIIALTRPAVSFCFTSAVTSAGHCETRIEALAVRTGVIGIACAHSCATVHITGTMAAAAHQQTWVVEVSTVRARVAVFANAGPTGDVTSAVAPAVHVVARIEGLTLAPIVAHIAHAGSRGHWKYSRPTVTRLTVLERVRSTVPCCIERQRSNFLMLPVDGKRATQLCH